MKNCMQCGINEAQAQAAGRVIAPSPIHCDKTPQHLCDVCMGVIYPGAPADVVHVEEHTRSKPATKKVAAAKPKTATPDPVKSKKTTTSAPKKKSSTSKKG